MLRTWRLHWNVRDWLPELSESAKGQLVLLQEGCEGGVTWIFQIDTRLTQSRNVSAKFIAPTKIWAVQNVPCTPLKWSSMRQSVRFMTQIVTKIGLPFCKPASHTAMRQCSKICRQNIGNSWQERRRWYEQISCRTKSKNRGEHTQNPLRYHTANLWNYSRKDKYLFCTMQNNKQRRPWSFTGNLHLRPKTGRL